MKNRTLEQIRAADDCGCGDGDCQTCFPKPAIKAPRRRYRFPDRGAAEDELSAVEHERHLYVRLARAQYSNTIQWVGKRGAYRVGLFDFDATGQRTPKVVVVFAPGGQEPGLQPHDAYAWVDATIGEFSQYNSKEAQGLVELADLVSRSLRANKLITNCFGS